MSNIKESEFWHPTMHSEIKRDIVGTESYLCSIIENVPWDLPLSWQLMTALRYTYKMAFFIGYKAHFSEQALFNGLVHVHCLSTVIQNRVIQAKFDEFRDTLCLWHIWSLKIPLKC